jgi:Kef-type K+ transport system membrane component KefB
LGFILLTAGLALHFGLSVLLANMFLAAVLVNINKTSFKFFDALRAVDSPFYLLFFVLAGVNLLIDDVNFLGVIGVLGLIYVFSRLPGEMIGASLGAHVAKAQESVKKFIGLGLAPQAGVALGLALIAKSTFVTEINGVSIGSIIFSTIVLTTVFYELIGPICTKIALKKAGDIE